MRTEFGVAARWQGGYDEDGLESWAAETRSMLGDRRVSLGIVFLTPRMFSHAAQVLEILRVHAQIPLLVGASSTSLIAGGEETESCDGIALGLYALPGADLRGVYFNQARVEAAAEPDHWVQETGVPAKGTEGWLAFLDPFAIDAERWLKQWNTAYAGQPVFGGFSSGASGEPRTQIYLDGEVYEEGGVAVAVGGGVDLTGVISQGCTPVGQTWTITRAERNLIQELGGRPAYEILAQTFQGLTPEEQQRARGNLFVGLVVDEYREEFRRGDFLVRNLLGVDPQSGALAVGALPRAGQTLQFQRRDAAAASEDLRTLLRQARERLAGRSIYGGFLCCCNGRGESLFGTPSHDAGLIQAELGPLSVAGFFGNGEIGPVGERNFLHGYTASLGLFVERSGGSV
jgi:small ligand-binding sensory domain FIST